MDGWEPETTTEVIEWVKGRPAKWVTRRESEWNEEQEAWFLALALYRNGLCPSCGLPREECMSIANDGKYRATAMRCHATTARLIEAERYRDNPQSDALLYAVELG